MGASLSSLTEGANGSAIGPSLGDIPESCVACVFLYLTPPEICNLARLNRAFRGAASSDSVWEKKLPSNYQDLLHLMPPESYRNLSKKDIFALLSRPVPIDDGNKDFGLVGSRGMGNFDLRLSSCFVPMFENEEMGDKMRNAETGVQEVWLDRVTGRVCMAVSAKGMAITGIDDRRYWNWIPTEESSRFHVVAYLQQIWWFEVDGVVKFPFPADVYTVTFRLHLGRFSKRLGRRVSSFEHTHGWDIKPVRFELSADGLQTLSECSLDDTEEDNINGNHKRGCWIEYKLGEFVVSESEPAPEVRFSMKQIDCTHSKGGLCVDSVFIFPSNLRELRRKGDLK